MSDISWHACVYGESLLALIIEIYYDARSYEHQNMSNSMYVGTLSSGTAVAQWLRYCATNRKVAGSIPDGVIGNFYWHKSFWSHYGPGVHSFSNRNEYQEYFLGGKCGRCVRLTTLPPSCAVVMKSGKHNFLEPSGPLQTCNGTAFLLWVQSFILLMPKYVVSDLARLRHKGSWYYYPFHLFTHHLSR
jgi:hypothetical protein